MSLAVLPLLTHRPPAINVRWWVQLVGHFPFVGLPIVAMIGSARFVSTPNAPGVTRPDTPAAVPAAGCHLSASRPARTFAL